jgi:glycosyltransferase involved in cell wall biosynthesis
MTDTTVIIKTIGRPSLKAAIASAKREKFKVIVVSDGVKKISAQGASKIVTLGKQWGYFGGMAANVGAAMAETEFITFLDDDDVFIQGAGDIIRKKLKENPHIDIWSGGVRFSRPVHMVNTQTQQVISSSTDFAIDPEKGLVEGNVAMPTYRTSIFSKIPFTDHVREDQQHLTDIMHVNACVTHGGYTLGWFEEVIYLVRPHDKTKVNAGGEKIVLIQTSGLVNILSI